MKMLPVGLEDFQEIRSNGFYYIDKTKLIEQLLENWSKVNLFTRPRRFGKTLNMSMLKNFFEIGTDRALFEGLFISANKELCEKYMGKYPVIFLSMKGVDGLTFEAARYRLTELIGVEAERFAFLSESMKLTDNERKKYDAIINLVNGKYSMDVDVLISSLQTLSQLLYKHYDQKVIILIDEYDVPLDKAFQHGYYQEIVSLIRGLFGQALKTNSFLQFAVLTGCLRVSKESIFTGLNNFKVYAADDVRYDEEFGFTNEEVTKLLADYNLQEHFTEIKEWYDGYRFGNADIYCPWDVINYVDDLMPDPYMILIMRVNGHLSRLKNADMKKISVKKTGMIFLHMGLHSIRSVAGSLWRSVKNEKGKSSGFPLFGVYARSSHFIPEKATEWQILTHNSRI